MLTLASKLKRDDGVKGPRTSNSASDSTRRVSVRDKLLVKEVAELEVNLPCTCEVKFPDPNKLHYFLLTVNPDEGYYQNGTFQFEIEVPDAYNMVDWLRLFSEESLRIEQPIKTCLSVNTETTLWKRVEFSCSTLPRWDQNIFLSGTNNLYLVSFCCKPLEH